MTTRGLLHPRDAGSNVGVAPEISYREPKKQQDYQNTHSEYQPQTGAFARLYKAFIHLSQFLATFAAVAQGISLFHVVTC